MSEHRTGRELVLRTLGGKLLISKQRFVTDW